MTEGAKILADWFANATYGVNALAASVPRGSDPAPPAVTVANELEDAWVTRNDIPRDVLEAGGAYLAVYQEGDGAVDTRVQRMSGTVGEIAGEATYAILYVTLDADSASAAVDAKNVLRAALGSLLLLHDEHNAASRTRNGFRLETPTAIRRVPLHEAKGDALVAGALIVTYTTRESAPFIT